MNKKTDNNQKNQRIQVFARCRPLNSIEKKQNSPSVVEVIPDKKVIVKDRNANREFLFDKVFPPDTKQISVYKAVVEPLIQEVLMGYNCTVFAYGQTGTGKTYTMEGERNNSTCSWEDDPGAGIIPRSLHQLFEDLNKEDNVEFSVRVSFLELYNEELFDLLSSTDFPKLRIYEGPNKKGSVVIQGLEEIIVNCKDEVYSILERGSARRQTAATMLNATSSRSHTVFSVTVHIKENTIEGEELLKTGKLNLVDLAGSENVGRSGAVDKRAREAGNINQSLLTLGRVITALIEKQPHVPYRESKLTRLLQDSLGGHTKTSIIATISPAQCNFDETISTLDYATKAKSITINPEANQKMTKRALIREYTEEIERLRKDLVASRSKDGFYIDMDNYTNLMNEVTEKKDLVKDLTEHIEVLKTEITKIEEMFKETKEELTITHEKLNETSQKYEETASKLSNTTDALSFTQKILNETALERDEKQFLINVQSNTEKKLSQQAQTLLHVAEETTNDVDKLHAKIDRKTLVEKTNEERCAEFKKNYQEQFAMLDNLVSYSEKQQVTNLLKTKEDIDNILQALLDHNMDSTKFLNEFTSQITSNMETVSKSFTSGANSQMQAVNSLAEELIQKKEVLLSKQNLFLVEKFPEFVNIINTKSSAIQKWILDVHKQMSKKIEIEKDNLCKRSIQRKELQNSMKDSLDSLCKSYDSILKDFQVQSMDICSIEDKIQKEFDETLSNAEKALMSFKKVAEQLKEVKKNKLQCDNSLITSIKENDLKFAGMHQSLKELHNFEYEVEENKENLDKMLSVLNIDEFSNHQDSLSQAQETVFSEFEKSIKEHQKEEVHIFLEAESSLKEHVSSVSQNVQSLNQEIKEIISSLLNFAQSGKSSDKKDMEKMKSIIDKSIKDISESQECLFSIRNKFKDEIQKMDVELESFIPGGLLKDIPTGITPQRKNYSYPRTLAATSPHERILERFRTKLAEDTAIAINLPLNSSFNELEKSPLTLKNSYDVIDINNTSICSDDSWDTDSCASSVSDVTMDRKNKENWKKSKKRSRLPKRLANKNFLKPALPSIKKPMVLSNSVEQDSFKEIL